VWSLNKAPAFKLNTDNKNRYTQSFQLNMSDDSGPTTIIVLGAYGEFVGKFIALDCLKRPNVITKILVRPNYAEFAAKKEIVDDLASKGAVVVFGDASDPATLIPAFDGVDIVISALGGWVRLLLNMFVESL
jgi:saccharopine dehydrogenase-like NADP-dependent oxidoreductase